MIALTEKSRVAVLALTELAQRSDGPVPIVDVAERRSLPLHVVEQLFAALRRAGILQSQRGVKGGYTFRRSPDTVTLSEVVDVVDGRIEWDAPIDPAAGDTVWRDLCLTVTARLSEVTVSDIVEMDARATDAPMFHI